MARFIKKHTETRGQSPGALIFVGNQKMEKSRIRLIDYNSEGLKETEIENIEQILAHKNTDRVSWINIDGVHDTNLIKKVGEIFAIHPLHLEDIMNTDQRPRFEEGNDYLFFVLKMLKYDNPIKKISAEQISLILGRNYLITFQEQVGDVFEPVRNRIRNAKGRIRSKNNDYLAFALLDIIADNYMILVETIGEQIEELEQKIMVNPSKTLVQEIYTHKMELNYLRKAIRPVRDLVLLLLKSETNIIRDDTVKYFNDLNEIVVQTTDAIETYHVIISDQLSIYNTIISNRLNEVMKVLTIFASIFIPLTFLAGVYGMNFKYIPELDYKYSYLIFWIIVLIIFSSMWLYFKRKKWM